MHGLHGSEACAALHSTRARYDGGIHSPQSSAALLLLRAASHHTSWGQPGAGGRAEVAAAQTEAYLDLQCVIAKDLMLPSHIQARVP